MPKPWKTQEKQRAIQWRNHERTPVYIARRLGRSVEDVEAFLGDIKRGERTEGQPRNCLGCGREFMSEGPHNRMCDTCRRNSAGVPPAMLDIGDGCRRAGGGRKA